MNAINVLIVTGEIIKTGTIDMTFHKPAREANPYIRLGYIPLNICNHTQGQVSVSMNDDPINMIHPNKKSTKEGFTK